MDESGDRSEKERQQLVQMTLQELRPFFGNHDPHDLDQRLLKFVETFREYVQ